MYPYNINRCTRQQETVPDVKARESSKTLNRLGKDKQFLSMMEVALDETKSTGDNYDALSKRVKEKKDSESLRTCALDQKKHEKQLQDISYQITGQQMAPPSAQPTASSSATTGTFSAELENLLADELENTDFYRELMLNMPEGELRNTMFEIFTDKQDHCFRLTILCCKYSD